MGQDETIDRSYERMCEMASDFGEDLQNIGDELNKIADERDYWKTRATLAEKLFHACVVDFTKSPTIDSDMTAYNKFIEENKEP